MDLQRAARQHVRDLREDRRRRPARGISAFFVDRDTPGLTVGKPLGKLGQRAGPAAEVFLNDVEVPASALIDGEGAGFLIAMKVFDRSRPRSRRSASG